MATHSAYEPSPPALQTWILPVIRHTQAISIHHQASAARPMHPKRLGRADAVAANGKQTGKSRSKAVSGWAGPRLPLRLPRCESIPT